jgi:hypothetical protein
MAKFELNPGETLIGKGQMALHQRQYLNTRPISGHIYVTDQRACFYVTLLVMGTMEMDLPLGEIKGFSVKKGLITSVTIHSKAGETFVFTGFPSKKLQDWLRQAGVREL